MLRSASAAHSFDKLHLLSETANHCLVNGFHKLSPCVATNQ